MITTRAPDGANNINDHFQKGAVYGLYDITHEWLPRKGELYGSHDAQDPSCLFIEESEGSAQTYLSHRWELMVTRVVVKRMMPTMVIGPSVDQNGPLMVYNCRYAHQGWFVGIKRSVFKKLNDSSKTESCHLWWNPPTITKTILLNIIIINQFFWSDLEYQRMGKRRLFPPDKKQLNSCTSPWVLLYHGGWWRWWR